MELPADYREKKTTAAPRVPGTPKYERQELIGKFLDRLNPDRKTAGLDEMEYVQLSTLLKGKKDGDLYRLYQECERGRSFSRLFWYLLRRNILDEEISKEV